MRTRAPIVTSLSTALPRPTTVPSPRTARSRTKAWSPTIAPAPSRAPARTTALQQTTAPSPTSSGAGASRGALEWRASLGGLPSTAPSWSSQPAPTCVPGWTITWPPIRVSGPIRAPAPITENGPIATPSATTALSSTTTGKSPPTLTAGHPSRRPRTAGESEAAANTLLRPMCGIVGYVGGRPAQEILLEGLEKLEYRGYDSAGISVHAEGRLDAVRAVGNLARLRAAVDAGEAEGEAAVAVLAPPATTGIGHTRWATHGRVSEENAHPHYDSDDRVHVVVNGIVENYTELKQELLAQGAVFSSETDVEVIAHLIARDLDAYDLVEAVRRTYARLRGHYSFVAMAADDPGLLVGVRKECPLIVGRGEGEQFLASGIPAFLAHTRNVQIVEDGEIVVVRAEGVEFRRAADGAAFEREITGVDWDADAAEKGGFETFMLKEIHEQADAVAETIAD